MAASSQPFSAESVATELASLRTRLQEAEETLRAIRSGEIDALLVESVEGEQVFTLKGAEHGYRLFVESMHEGAVTIRPDGLVLYCNARFASLVNLPVERVIGSYFQLYISSLQLKEVTSFLQKTEDRREEFELAPSSGPNIPVVLAISAALIEESHEGMSLIVTDLRNQKYMERLERAQQALKESESRYRTLAEAIPQLAWTCLPNGRCDYLSQQWETYTGCSVSEHLGHQWLPAIHPSDLPESLQQWEIAVNSGQNYDFEFRIRAAQGGYRWFKTRGIAVRNQRHEVVRWFGTCTDIQDIVEARQILNRDNEHLEELVKQRTASLHETTEQLNSFCYSIAHDLRAPLRAQQGYAQIISEDYGHLIGEEGKEFTNRIVAAAAKLEKLVEDLLSHASIGRADLNLETVDFAAIVDQVRMDLREEIDRSRAQIEWGPLSGIVLAHGSSLSLVISNLLTQCLEIYQTQPNSGGQAADGRKGIHGPAVGGRPWHWYQARTPGEDFWRLPPTSYARYLSRNRNWLGSGQKRNRPYGGTLRSDLRIREGKPFLDRASPVCFSLAYPSYTTPARKDRTSNNLALSCEPLCCDLPSLNASIMKAFTILLEPTGSIPYPPRLIKAITREKHGFFPFPDHPAARRRPWRRSNSEATELFWPKI